MVSSSPVYHSQAQKDISHLFGSLDQDYGAIPASLNRGKKKETSKNPSGKCTDCNEELLEEPPTKPGPRQRRNL